MIGTDKEKATVLFDLTLKSFEEIIKEITEVDIEKTDSLMISSNNALSVVIGFSGEVDGRILLNTTYEDAQQIAKFMNFGDEVTDKDEVFMCFAEFSNMYCGRAATHMNDAFGARAIWITPPAIFSASDLNIISPNLVTQKAYYKADFGSFILDVGVKGEEDDFGF